MTTAAPERSNHQESGRATDAEFRRRVPWWAMITLALVPVWGFMYLRAVTAASVDVEGPLGIGAQEYGGCASCHGAEGGGGFGRQFSNGEILATFPNIEDQLRFVYWGTERYGAESIEIYGNPDRDGGPHVTGSFGPMPQQGSLAGGDKTDAEILGLVCHERYTLGGADPNNDDWTDEFEQFCSNESPVFAALMSGEYTLASEEFAEFLDTDGNTFTINAVGSPKPGTAAKNDD